MPRRKFFFYLAGCGFYTGDSGALDIFICGWGENLNITLCVWISSRRAYFFQVQITRYKILGTHFFKQNVCKFRITSVGRFRIVYNLYCRLFSIVWMNLVRMFHSSIFFHDRIVFIRKNYRIFQKTIRIKTDYWNNSSFE